MRDSAFCIQAVSENTGQCPFLCVVYITTVDLAVFSSQPVFSAVVAGVEEENFGDMNL